MEKVLYVLDGSMKVGGTEAFIMNYYRNMNHSELIIDFIVPCKEKGIYDDELRKYGSTIYYISDKRKHPILYSMEIGRILKNERYKIVHSHMDAMGVWPLFIAKCKRVKIRIAHSHNTNHQTQSKIHLLVCDFAKFLLRKVATHFCACSKEAAIFLFGKEKNVKIINNAIDVKKFQFDDIKRERIRESLGVKNELIIGHVGQFREQKNHRFMLEIFSRLKEEYHNSRLVFVGDGPLEDAIRKEVIKKNLKEDVIFCGARDDVCDLLNAFDVFLFPSLFEGLGIVVIEAQANGLYCVTSSEIPEEACLTDAIKRIELSENCKVWVDEIIKTRQYNRTKYGNMVSEKGYDIRIEAKKMEEFYMGLCKE